MKGLNCVMVIGNVVRDVELRTSKAGAEYASFTLAISNTYKDREGNKVDSVTYIDCVAFGQTAKVAASYLRKGSPSFVRGSLSITKKLTESGENRTYTSVKVDELILLPDGRGRSQGAASESLDGYFPPEKNASNGDRTYSNRPFPGNPGPSAPQSIREEYMGINPELDTSFDFGSNTEEQAPWGDA